MSIIFTGPKEAPLYVRQLANMRIGHLVILNQRFELYLCQRRPGIEFRDGIRALERLVGTALSLRERPGVDSHGPFIKHPMAATVRPAAKLANNVPMELFALALLLGSTVAPFDNDFFFMVRAIDMKRYVCGLAILLSKRSICILSDQTLVMHAESSA